MKIKTIFTKGGQSYEIEDGSFFQALVEVEYYEYHPIISKGELVFEEVPFREEVPYYLFKSGGNEYEIKESQVAAIKYEEGDAEVIEI